MTEEDKLHTAQNFITWKLKKTARTKTTAITWVQDKTDPKAGIYRLTVYADGTRDVFTFTTDELTKWYDSWRWETRFLKRVREILAETGVRECKRQPLPER